MLACLSRGLIVFNGKACQYRTLISPWHRRQIFLWVGSFINIGFSFRLVANRFCVFKRPFRWTWLVASLTPLTTKNVWKMIMSGVSFMWASGLDCLLAYQFSVNTWNGRGSFSSVVPSKRVPSDRHSKSSPNSSDERDLDNYFPIGLTGLSNGFTTITLTRTKTMYLS